MLELNSSGCVWYTATYNGFLISHVAFSMVEKSVWKSDTFDIQFLNVLILFIQYKTALATIELALNINNRTSHYI